MPPQSSYRPDPRLTDLGPDVADPVKAAVRVAGMTPAQRAGSCKNLVESYVASYKTFYEGFTAPDGATVTRLQGRCYPNCAPRAHHCLSFLRLRPRQRPA